MELQHIDGECYYFHGSVNMGYITNGKHGLLIDAGLDKGTAKKIIKALKEKNLPLTDLFITHAHTDHFGGAAYLQEQLRLTTYAPEFEEALLRNPRLEPIYLFQGNEPIQELRSKFLEGPPIVVDYLCSKGKQEIRSFEVLLLHVPGHSYGQLALEYKGILYAADAYFDQTTLNKHNIPFIVDVTKTQESLKALAERTKVKGAVPGHGIFEENYKQTILQNLRYHETIIDELLVWLNEKGGCVRMDDAISGFCEKRGVMLKTISSFVLYRTAVMAYVKGLVDQGKAKLEMEGSYLFIRVL
ncbi:MBL fold metallo-hydrolase [Halalkalibacterium ligniniphilum]|uniref:MBL fold metallo-hydrolase n=1 Tax=Halalkalibacterium ligniniphilum TaxID=1134413 RepID=UPI00034689D5|nr:MBL fold metallo-hydrolase [Halalkalibacterium ligniniphilum]